MRKKDPEERVYFDDSMTKVTASFAVGYKKIILPVSRITDVIVTHKSYSMYLCFLCCVMLLLMLFLAPISSSLIGIDIPADYVFYFFIPVFGGCCIWFRFIYENYVELYIELDDHSRHLLRVITLGKRTVVYNIAEAVQHAVKDYHDRCDAGTMQDTDSLKIRRLRDMMIQSHVDMSQSLKKIMRPTVKSNSSAAL